MAPLAPLPLEGLLDGEGRGAVAYGNKPVAATLIIKMFFFVYYHPICYQQFLSYIITNTMDKSLK